MKAPGQLACLILLAAGGAFAHEGGVKNKKPTKAQPDLKTSARQLRIAKKKLAAEGRYTCSVRPSCDLCARTNGSCQCGVCIVINEDRPHGELFLNDFAVSLGCGRFRS